VFTLIFTLRMGIKSVSRRAAYSLLLFAILVATPCYGIDYFMVSRVVDGDTVILNDNSRVRFIGVDTPEHHPSSKLQKDAKRSKQDVETIKALGKRATAFTKQLVEGKKVRIEYGQERKDRYGRTLGYLYLQDDTFVNLEIIKQGYGVAYTKYPFKYMDEFMAAEKAAREAKRGLWSE
jgi:micrococcal nuclease